MLFVEPPATPYDLQFRIGRVPVRVHWMFWLLTALLGYQPGAQLAHVALWVLAVFISILVHELGHVAAFRYFGAPSRVLIYSFGGLAIPQGSVPRATWAQIIISLAGPAAGFALALLLLLIAKVLGNQEVIIQFGGSSLVFVAIGPFSPFNLWLFALFLLEVNVFWGILNLLPIFPLDGGQVARSVLTHVDPMDGQRKTFIVSIVVALLIAVMAFTQWKQTFLGLLFAYLAYQNYTMLQALTGRFGGGRPW